MAVRLPPPEGAPLRVLHVAAEVFPLVKTGGLADVAAALPPALARAGADVRLLLPGLPPVMDAVQAVRVVIDIGACFGAMRVRLLLGRMPQTRLPVYIVDAPYLYRRGGSPYQDSQGQEWPDNLQRFALLWMEIALSPSLSWKLTSKEKTDMRASTEDCVTTFSAKTKR